jgi:hypothetical protein
MEVKVINATSSSVVSSDIIEMESETICGPWSYHMMSNSCDSSNWSIDACNSKKRGGNRGYAPLLAVLSDQDIVFAKVRDIYDRICSAVVNKDFAMVFLFKLISFFFV